MKFFPLLCFWTEERLVPFSHDERLPPDLLYFIIEEDFRWYPEGEDPQGHDKFKERAEKTKKKQDRAASLPPCKRGTIALEPDSSKYNKMGHPVESTTTGKGKGKKGQDRVKTRYFESRPRGSGCMDDADEGMCENVADMVRMAKYAHCKGMGDIIWCSWVPRGPKGKSSGVTILQRGTAMLMLTKKGFGAFDRACEAGDIPPGHIDIVLKNWLTKTAKEVNACYIYPCVGSYIEHPSDCDPKNYGGSKTRIFFFILCPCLCSPSSLPPRTTCHYYPSVFSTWFHFYPPSILTCCSHLFSPVVSSLFSSVNVFSLTFLVFRPSGFVTDQNVAWGTKVSHDEKGREKYLIQWDKPHNEWIKMPTDDELHGQVRDRGHGRWLSYWDESTTSQSAAGLDGQEEVDEDEPTTRMSRHRRKWLQQNNQYRHWTKDESQATYCVSPSPYP